MILALAKIFVSPKRFQKILDLLEPMRRLPFSASGCLECSIYEAQGDDLAIVYLEKWRSRTEMIDHIRSPLYSRVLTVLELSERPPEICFYEITGTEGMELVEGVVRSPASEV